MKLAKDHNNTSYSLKYFFIFMSTLIFVAYCYCVLVLSNKFMPNTLKDSIPYAISINFLCLILSNFLTLGLKLYHLIPNKYYSNIDIEFIDKIYKIFIVKYFKKVVTIIPYGRITNKSHHSDEQIIAEIERTKIAEIGHTIPFPILIITCLLFFRQQMLLSITILFMSLFFHIQPIILQRYNRIRYSSHLKKYNKK